MNSALKDISYLIVLSKPNQIKSAGYPVEIHQIKTEDEYILHAFRIPYGRKSPQTNRTRPLVLIMHGLMDSSNGFVVLSPEDSLGKVFWFIQKATNSKVC